MSILVDSRLRKEQMFLIVRVCSHNVFRVLIARILRAQYVLNYGPITSRKTPPLE